MKKTYTLFKRITLASALLTGSLSFAQTAKIQIIHNAADPAAALVDIYAGTSKLLDNVAFRSASPYLTVPAGMPIPIGVAPSTSMSSAEALYTVNITLTSGETYVAVANGVLGSNFAKNPNGKPTSFEIWLKSGAKETAPAGKVDLIVVHGSTDAPAVDVVAEGVGTLVNNAVYSDITNYISVPAASYTLAVKDSTGATTVARFAADLSALGGNSAVVLASGFLNTATNNNGPAFGLFAALPTGGALVPLDVVTATKSKIQSFENVLAYPVPTNNNLNLEFNNVSETVVDVEVLDNTGRSIISSTESLNSGSNRISINTELLSSGSYIAKIKGQTNVSVINFTISK